MKILIEEGTGYKTEVLERVAKRALELEGVDEERIEISLTFVEPEEIKEINSQFRNIDKVTDVLSFPQFSDVGELKKEIEALDYNREDFELEEDELSEIPIGDVVICTQRAKEQAEEFGHSLDREIVYLFVHSILHLLGYDHMQEDEKAVMRAREEEIMNFVDLPR